MEKYHNEDEINESRVQRNKSLYNQPNIDIDDNINLDSNVSIIDSSTLKKMIDKDNRDEEKDNMSFLEYEDEVYENTKEYDLKKIIDEAHKDKEDDYESTRYKRLRESEYEILKSINFEKKEEDPSPLTEDEKTLVDLIKTVEMNALKRSEEKRTELMGDLMGDDNTEVLEPVEISDDTDFTIPKPTLVEELEKTKQLSKGEIEEAIKADEEKEVEAPQEKQSVNTKEIPLENSFYTGNLSIKKRDLDDFKDLQKELKGGSVFIKILIAFIIIIVIAVGVYLANKYFNLGLF